MPLYLSFDFLMFAILHEPPFLYLCESTTQHLIATLCIAKEIVKVILRCHRCSHNISLLPYSPSKNQLIFKTPKSFANAFFSLISSFLSSIIHPLKAILSCTSSIVITSLSSYPWQHLKDNKTTYKTT